MEASQNYIPQQVTNHNESNKVVLDNNTENASPEDTFTQNVEPANHVASSNTCESDGEYEDDVVGTITYATPIVNIFVSAIISIGLISIGLYTLFNSFCPDLFNGFWKEPEPSTMDIILEYFQDAINYVITVVTMLIDHVIVAFSWFWKQPEPTAFEKFTIFFEHIFIFIAGNLQTLANQIVA
ncbi:uncharacterized protein [Clytia hemisphaerica]|uniref:uncharacterized protein n=1 Tax=Clytia hemisphaerica TaxID=252671 RepID=UPI0034D5B648